VPRLVALLRSISLWWERAVRITRVPRAVRDPPPHQPTGPLFSTFWNVARVLAVGLGCEKHQRVTSMNEELRATGKSLLFYIFGISSLIVVAWLCLSAILRPNESMAAKDEGRESTRIATVVANAREIRAALGKSLSAPEPLGPITQKPARALGGPKVAAARVHTRKAPLSSEAREAFASSDYQAQPVVQYDRHVSNY
jgi:hypothetical protein